jgi:hypothetical protein
MFLEFEVNWQAAENVKTPAHPCDEKVFTLRKLIEDG